MLNKVSRMVSTAVADTLQVYKDKDSPNIIAFLSLIDVACVLYQDASDASVFDLFET